MVRVNVPIYESLSYKVVLGQVLTELLEPTRLLHDRLAHQRRHTRGTVDTEHVRTQVHLGMLTSKVYLEIHQQTFTACLNIVVVLLVLLGGCKHVRAF